MEVIDDKYCFACGKENPIGLKMKFEEIDENTVLSKIALNKNFQGWNGIIHGGIVATMLDEAAAYLCGYKFNVGCVTAEIKVKYRIPTPTDNEISVYAKFEKKKGPLLYIKSFIKYKEKITAEADLKMFLTTK